MVEGPSDCEAFSQWLQLLYPKNISIEFIPYGGSGQIPKYMFISYMMKIHLNFTLYIIRDSDGSSIKEIIAEIVEAIKKSDPNLLSSEIETQIRNNIYVLNKKTLESYYLKRNVLAQWLNTSIEEIETKLKTITENNPVAKLRILANFYGKTFKKTQCHELLACFTEDLIDPEIFNLIQHIISLYITEKS